MKPLKLARGGIAAILTLILFAVVFVGQPSEAQGVKNTWDRTDAMLEKAPVAANYDYLRVTTQEVSPNYWRATVFSTNTQETKTFYLQHSPSHQNRFKAEPDYWAELARRTYLNPNIASTGEVIARWVPDIGEPSASLASTEQKPPAKYGRTLAEMRAEAQRE